MIGRILREESMTIIHYNYSETELKEILDSMVLIVDTREQKNQHVLEYLRKRKH